MEAHKETKCIKYTKGYKYMLEEDAWFYTGIKPDQDFITKRVIHYTDGWMLIKEGFCWDGCSGPTWDDKSNMRAGLMHDGVYYLLRHGFSMAYRSIGDKKLRDLMIEDGAIRARANYYQWAVSHFGKGSAEPKNQRVVQTAP